jgi:RimJ/RimL family protein N-acetyltransferase
VAAFVAKLLDEKSFANCTAVGFLDKDGKLEAGAVYNNWQPDQGIIEITAASIHRKWGTLGRLRVIYSYPFDFLGCQMVVARTSEHNAGPLRIWKALGADFYRIPRLRGRDEAGIITTLTVEQWQGSRFHE